MNRDTTILAVCAILLFLMGGISGWTLRTVTVRDHYLSAMAESFIAERDYYGKQAEAIIAEGVQIKQKEKPKHGAKKD